MSSDKESREALSEAEEKKLNYELRPFPPEKMKEWLETPGNRELLTRSSEITRTMVQNKMDKLKELEAKPGSENVFTSGKAPAIISELSSSEPPKPAESQDVRYLTNQEIIVERTINTINTLIVEDDSIDSSTHSGPWVERFVGKDQKTGQNIIAKTPGKEYTIPPWEVMQFLGNVVSDRLSVHSTNILLEGRIGYVFDRFYWHNQKRLERCCWVPNKIHQAGMMYERYIDKKTRQGMSRIARVDDTSKSPKYMVVGAKEGGGTTEGYYRDLKRLYERYFLRRGDGAITEDEGLLKLINTIQP